MRSKYRNRRWAKSVSYAASLATRKRSTPMLRTLLIALLFASPALAQSPKVDPLAAAGCGANETQFEVKTDKSQHQPAQPADGKALVYVIGASSRDYVSFHFGTPLTRFGVDGNWMGANGYRSYFFFSVEPGDHRLCSDIQSRIGSAVRSSAAATSFTAEAGKIYYFRTKTPQEPTSDLSTKLVPIDPAEANVLIASTAFSTFHLKK